MFKNEQTFHVEQLSAHVLVSQLLIQLMFLISLRIDFGLFAMCVCRIIIVFAFERAIVLQERATTNLTQLRLLLVLVYYTSRRVLTFF